MTVYIDEFVIINTILNYVILYTTKKVIKSKKSNLRLFICSIASSIASLVLLITQAYFFTNFIVKFLFSIILIYVSFNFNNIKTFFKTIIVFYFINFTIGGCGYALYNILTSTPYYSTFKLLLITVTISYIVINMVISIYKSYCKHDSLTHKLTIKYNDKTIEIPCFYDTGNNLHDPITGLPVIVTDISVLKQILPQKMTDLFIENKNPFDIYQILHKDMNLKLIPYHTVTENGFMIGFIPTFIEIDDIKTNAIIGIVPMKKSESKAILNPDIINTEAAYEYKK